MSKLMIGQRVRWTSQAGGNHKTKEGVVVFTQGDARKDPQLNGRRSGWPAAIANIKFSNHRRMFDGGNWLTRDGGILVEVRDGKTDKARPKLYMPKPQTLEVVDE